jgi:hypothetical protein
MNDTGSLNSLICYSLFHLINDMGTKNSIHPGFVKTELMRGVTKSSSILGFFGNISSSLVALSPSQGALTTLYCATSPDIEVFYSPCATRREKYLRMHHWLKNYGNTLKNFSKKNYNTFTFNYSLCVLLVHCI